MTDLHTYRYQTDIPDIVSQATALASRMRFPHSCSADTGRLLRVLAAYSADGTIAEIGTGCGVGTAWLLSGMSPPKQLITVEMDADRVSATRSLFAPYPQVRVLAGDWRQLCAYAPYRLIFVDVKEAKHEGAEEVVAMLEPGGLIVMDDFTPEAQWPAEWRGKPDPVRQFWLNDPRLISTEILTTTSSAVVLGVRSA